MKPQALMLIGGSERTNNDHAWLLKHEGKSTNWSCPKEARAGDIVLIYIAAPISQVIASAIIAGAPRPGSELGYRWRYVARIGPIKLLPAPISLDELQKLCPRWKWLRYPRAYAYIPPLEAAKIVRRAKLKKIAIPELTLANNGAGFGTPEMNRKVEAVAVKEVTRYYRHQGFSVQSRERDNLGYDLEVTKGRRALHVEVKGVAGSVPAFPITTNEVRCAKIDKSFTLAVVTNALVGRHRKIVHYTAREFLTLHALTPITFMAKLKKQPE